MNIAFFDFDGTITKKDSMAAFLVHAVGSLRFILGLVVLSPVLAAYKLRLIPNYRAKSILISWFLKGMSESELENISKDFAENKLDAMVRSGASEKILWHQNQGDEVVVVSASMDCWLRPWCERHNVKLISTELEVVSGKVTGRFKTKNCHGQEKVNRINSAYNLSYYENIYAYGDSGGDREMLALADCASYKPFRD